MSYLIAITQREEVAQIVGNPVYLIADVALLPLTSQHEANEAIKSALASTDVDSDVSDSEQSDSEDTASHQTAATEVGSLPADDHQPLAGEKDRGSSFAREVATGNVSFGRFATQWLSRQRWPVANTGEKPTQPEVDRQISHATQESSSKRDITTTVHPEPESAANQREKPQQAIGVATVGLLPRILKTTKMIFTSRSYFFSYDLDLTRRFEKLGRLDQPLNIRNLDSLVSLLENYTVHH